MLTELRAGFEAGSRGAQIERTLVQFRKSPRVEVVFADEETTHHYARRWTQLRRAGTPIPTNALWIAALVVQHGAALFPRDRHFTAIPQIARVG